MKHLVTRRCRPQPRQSHETLQRCPCCAPPFFSALRLASVSTVAVHFQSPFSLSTLMVHSQCPFPQSTLSIHSQHPLCPPTSSTLSIQLCVHLSACSLYPLSLPTSTIYSLRVSGIRHTGLRHQVTQHHWPLSQSRSHR